MVNKLSIITAIIFISLMIIEIIYSRTKKVILHEKKDSGVSLIFGFLAVIQRGLMHGMVYTFYFWLYEFRLFDLGAEWWVWVLCFFGNEFIYYWFHRWSHEFRWLWATHVNHHSSEYLNFFTATRSPIFNAFHHMIFWIPLPLLGFHPLIVLVIEAWSFVFAFIQHTEIIPKLGIVEWVVNTPSHHRVHHASNPQYIDKNFGNTLIIFDRLFGTFREEKEKPKYGITKPVNSNNFFKVAFHEWQALIRDARQARSFRESWKYIFCRVGWKPKSEETVIHEGQKTENDQKSSQYTSEPGVSPGPNLQARG